MVSILLSDDSIIRIIGIRHINISLRIGHGEDIVGELGIWVFGIRETDDLLFCSARCSDSDRSEVV